MVNGKGEEMKQDLQKAKKGRREEVGGREEREEGN